MRRWMRMLAGAGVVALALTAGAGLGRAGVGAEGNATAPKVPRALSDFRISGTPYNEKAPAVAWNDTRHEYLVIWRDFRPLPTGFWIYGRRMSPAGAFLGAAFRITSVKSVSDEWSPVVAWNGTTNQYLVVWEDQRNSTNRGTDLYGQRLSATGSAVGGNIRISGPAARGHEYEPAVAWNATSKQYLVVWHDTRSPGGLRVYGQRLSATGAAVGGDFRIGDLNTLLPQRYPAVAWNQTRNQYLVVWQDSRDLSMGSNIYGQRLSAAGSALGSDFQISQGSQEEWPPAVAWNATNNQYLVVWGDWRNITSEPATNRGADIYGQRLAATGAEVRDDFPISNSTSNETDPEVVWNRTANQYLVVWQDFRSYATSGSDTYGRRVSSAGTPVQNDFRLSGPGATSTEESQAVAWNGINNQYLVLWQDFRNASSALWDIYGRRLAG